MLARTSTRFSVRSRPAPRPRAAENFRLSSVEWENVYLEEGTAWIIDPKNKNTAEIVLGDAALAIIKRQTRRGSYVFCKTNGEPFKTNMQSGLKRAAARAGVTLPPRKAWHIFRRTWASMMLQSGADVETLRVMGNWKDYQMPLWYAEASGQERRREILNKAPRFDEETEGSEAGRNREENQKVANLSDWKKG